MIHVRKHVRVTVHLIAKKGKMKRNKTKKIQKEEMG